MNRRGFFKNIVAVLGALCFGTKVMASPDRLHPGQVWWDKDCCWTDGSKELRHICILLSADRETFWDGEVAYLWKTANFIWCVDGYMGARVRKFRENEVRKMYLVGNISQVKGFTKA